MRFKVLIKESDGGFSISCPSLPGCWSQGDTEAEALENIREAIREYLAARDELLKAEGFQEIEVLV